MPLMVVRRPGGDVRDRNPPREVVPPGPYVTRYGKISRPPERYQAGSRDGPYTVGCVTDRSAWCRNLFVYWGLRARRLQRSFCAHNFMLKDY